MGAFDKLINFGGSLKGKIISWAVVLVGTTIFFIGVIMTNIGVGANVVKSLTLSAANMEYIPSLYGTDMLNYGGYHMQMRTLSAHISVFTDPMDTTEPVIFTTSSPLIEIDSKNVAAGSVAVIRMKKFNGQYGFSSPNPLDFTDVPRINVKCGRGGASATIFVRLVLDERDVRVTATLEQWVPYTGADSWYPVDHINMYYFNSGLSQMYYAVKYRVRLRVYIFEEKVLDTGEADFTLDNNDTYLDYPAIKSAYAPFRYQETWVHNLFKNTFEPSDGGEESFTKTLQLFRGQLLGTELMPDSDKYHIIAEYINDPLKVYFRISYRIQHGSNPQDFTDYFTKSDFVVNVLSYVPTQS